MALLKFGGCLAKNCSHLALSRRLPDKATERVATVDSKANAGCNICTWTRLIVPPANLKFGLGDLFLFPWVPDLFSLEKENAGCRSCNRHPALSMCSSKD